MLFRSGLLCHKGYAHVPRRAVFLLRRDTLFILKRCKP